MYRKLTLLVIVIAVALRLLLCWANPPDNAYDNHFKPISLMLENREIPAKDACFECYNPPVFYGISAVVGDLLFRAGAGEAAVTKSLQFLNCLYVILTLPLIYLILGRLRLSELSRLAALALVSFLPRHIYMSAIHSNDGLTYLSVALCAWLLLTAIDRKLPWQWAALLGGALSLAIFVKYTAFVVLPMAALPLAALALVKSEIPPRKALSALMLALLPPLILLGSYMAVNLKESGRLLPWNDRMIDTSVLQPRDPGGVSFTTFKPWQFVATPIVVPGQMQSFWTLVYTGAWFDNEPKFTNFTDRNNDWWSQYCYWLGGKASFPASPLPLSGYTQALAAGLITLGLIPFLLLIAGGGICLRRLSPSAPGTTLERIKLLAFPVLLGFNAAGIVMLALKAPVYSSMKTSYFLNSLPALAVFTALGFQAVEERRWARLSVCAVVVVLAGLASLHVLEIVWSLEIN